jgi:hypothetical protein
MMVEAEPNVIAADAMIEPLNVLEAPRVALVPTAQNTFSTFPPFVKIIDEPPPVITVVPATNIH